MEVGAISWQGAIERLGRMTFVTRHAVVRSLLEVFPDDALAAVRLLEGGRAAALSTCAAHLESATADERAALVEQAARRAREREQALPRGAEALRSLLRLGGRGALAPVMRMLRDVQAREP
jgi:hypothetical protein